ncbi:class I SAM-dependent methyltransferase [Brevibacillus brevis]|uniref:class I SAM-dependent methyltransferase n=1 Tax=Brevibacillus brevis TaxID=1393 RepID=UPI001159FA43|nr:class I SAM-dependent methyltransferase [Lysinibacillus sp. SDF0063]TQR32556.1 class I SAM-dependent methyltransferase [Lysinibacillus sp. SDF0063]
MPNTKKVDWINDEANVEYWDEYYKKAAMQEESTFCKYVKKQIDKNAIVLDIGCGSGRDTFSFAKDGYEVVGIDRSKEVIKINRNTKEEKFSTSKLDFHVVDLSDERTLNDILESTSRKAISEDKSLVVYLRFLLHSINEKTEEILLRTISKHVPTGCYFAAEFRTVEDYGRDKVYDDHYRRFIDAEDLVSNLEGKYNFSKIDFIKGTGLSVYKNEDPYLARILMKKSK